MKNLWFVEYTPLNNPTKDNYGKIYRIKSHIFSKQSQYQQIDIYDTYEYGKMLVINNAAQVTEKDEMFYHDMIVHVPMFTHQNPKRILIIGGGDGGALREVLKHPVDKVTIVELDEEVVNACKKYLPIHGGAYDDKRTELIIGDGLAYLKDKKKEFDVVIVDSTDPDSEMSAPLFSDKFFKELYVALKDDGLFSMQCSIPFFPIDKLKQGIFSEARKLFEYTKIYYTIMCPYGETAWPLLLGSKKYDPTKPRETKLKFKVYTTEHHKAVFNLPACYKEVLYH